jgi:hypothetical protein
MHGRVELWRGVGSAEAWRGFDSVGKCFFDASEWKLNDTEEGVELVGGRVLFADSDFEGEGGSAISVENTEPEGMVGFGQKVGTAGAGHGEGWVFDVADVESGRGFGWEYR